MNKKRLNILKWIIYFVLWAYCCYLGFKFIVFFILFDLYITCCYVSYIADLTHIEMKEE